MIPFLLHHMSTSRLLLDEEQHRAHLSSFRQHLDNRQHQIIKRRLSINSIEVQQQQLLIALYSGYHDLFHKLVLEDTLLRSENRALHSEITNLRNSLRFVHLRLPFGGALNIYLDDIIESLSRKSRKPQP